MENFEKLQKIQELIYIRELSEKVQSSIKGLCDFCDLKSEELNKANLVAVKIHAKACKDLEDFVEEEL